MRLIDLFRLYLDANYNVVLVVNWAMLAFVVVFALIAGLVLRVWHWRFASALVIDEAEIGIGNQKIKVRPSHEDRQIAYKLWVEMATRKIGMPVDAEHDVIVDVYSSWYEFFRVARELLKTVPVEKLRRSEDTRKLVNMAVEVLNDQLRPHLTRWQATYRRWYESECRKSDCVDLGPQKIQKRFPERDVLLADLLATNARLMKYRDVLHDLALQ
jgi:hypothetical protein